MLDKLCAHALEIIAVTPTCILSTTGPAGLQASPVSCVVRKELERTACPGPKRGIFVLVPSTSDHLFNLEQESKVVLTTERWQLRGLGRMSGPAQPGISPQTIHAPAIVVEVTPLQMHIEANGDGGHRETIDFW